MKNLQPPATRQEAVHEINELRAELDTQKVPKWREDEIQERLVYLRGWLHGRGLSEDNIQEPAPTGKDING